MPPEDDYRGDFQQEFTAEMDRVLGAVHGDVDLPSWPGHASGRYDADVSPWLLGYVIGREWEPYSVVAYNRLAAGAAQYQGEYFLTQAASPMEVWLAEVMDHLAREQMRRYHQQTPIAFTNWPTLDPLRHVSEATEAEENALRRQRGEDVGAGPPRLSHNEDEVTLDARHIQPTAQNRAGTFAAFHAYPYYPDFMNNEAAYRESPSGNYPAYLAELRQHFGEMPVLIAEVGVPSSRGLAHFQAQGFHHGGHSEAEQARLDVALVRQVEDAGLAGSAVFSLMDEWFKRNWLYQELERPADHGVRWHNVMDPEENYGLIAADPVGEVPLCGPGTARWPEVPGIPGVQAWATARYLHLVFPSGLKLAGAPRVDTLALDTHPAAGDEFQIVLGDQTGRLTVNAGYQPFKLRGGGEQVYYLPDLQAVPEADGPYVSFLTMPNARRIGRDGTVYPPQLDEPGQLQGGPTEPENARRATQDFCRTGARVHLRLPWTLIGVTDPSERRSLSGDQPGGSQAVADIGLSVGGRQGRWTWEPWTEPEYALRLKPAYAALKQAWQEPAP
ncbi:hypothetical protein [Deinococcus radiophilus]|uniref:hypothetical protein n=1 Tax=Deinococcus radiophilus TaxID=32062 RepID=UPI00360B67A9